MPVAVVLAALVWTSSATAFDLSGGVSALRQLEELIAIKEKLDKQLDRLREQKELLDKIRELQDLRHRAEEAVRNKRLSRLLEDLENELNAVFNSPEDQVAEINKTIEEIEEALSKTTDAGERAYLEQKKSALKRYQLLVEVRANANDNVEKTATALSESEAVKVTAESTAMLARLAVEQQAQSAQDQQADLDEQHTAHGMIRNSSEVLEAAGGLRPESDLFTGDDSG